MTVSCKRRVLTFRCRGCGIKYQIDLSEEAYPGYTSLCPACAMPWNSHGFLQCPRCGGQLMSNLTCLQCGANFKKNRNGVLVK